MNNFVLSLGYRLFPLTLQK